MAKASACAKDLGTPSLLLCTTKDHTWLRGGGSLERLDLGEIYKFRRWKGYSFDFWPHAHLSFRIGMHDPWEEHNLLPAFLVPCYLSQLEDSWLLKNRTVHQLEK